ncbi:hypothetical protein H0H92_015288 [Tricholoma furcatifolium]|nr:hypothetical protein H0H92_015288 [Tricholoma furcatifolium]
MGPSIQAKTISIAKYLRNKMENETFEGPLTDYDTCESDEDTDYQALKDKSSNVVWGSPTPCTSVSPNPLTDPGKPCASKTRRNKNRDKRRKNDKREGKAEEGVKAHVKKRQIEALKDALQFKFSLGENVIVTTTGWQGRRYSSLPKKNYTREEAEQLGMTHFPWNGRDTHLLLDQDFNVIGILLGQPRDRADSPGEWEALCKEAFEALHVAAASMNFSENECSHRRGAFPAVPHGISFGGGQKQPKHLSHNSTAKNNTLEGLMSTKCIQRICKFGSEGLRIYGRRNYDYMEKTMEALREHYDNNLDSKRTGLRRPYDKNVGVFPCRSFNLGNHSVSYPHTDDANLAQSWCSITPLGVFDAAQEGQIILWDLGIVVDFPSGSTILIPSALILHSNAPIAENKIRYSIIQYAAAGLFRWVENGFMSEEAWLAKATSDEIKEHTERQEKRWAEAAKMFTKLEELLPKHTTTTLS